MDRIETLAIFVRRVIGIPADTLPNITDILVRLRISKIIFDFRPGTPEELRGAAAKWVSNIRTILIDPRLWDRLENDVDSELRFTVLHEVGHAVLNHPDRNRRYRGAAQFGSTLNKDEDNADRFAMAFAIPLTFAETTNIFDEENMLRQFGLPKTKTDLRMADLQMHLRRPSAEKEMALAEIDLIDPEAWLRDNMQSSNPRSFRLVPTQDEDWDF